MSNDAISSGGYVTRAEFQNFREDIFRELHHIEGCINRIEDNQKESLILKSELHKENAERLQQNSERLVRIEKEIEGYDKKERKTYDVKFAIVMIVISATIGYLIDFMRGS